MKKLVCLVGIALPLTLSSCDRDGGATAPDPDPAPAEVRITDARLSPPVAREGETFTMELRIDGTSLPVLYGALGRSPGNALTRLGLRGVRFGPDLTDQVHHVNVPFTLSEAAVRRYYEHFPEDRDFLVLSHHVSLGMYPGARTVQMRNDARGIGLDARDFREWGSPARPSLVPRFSASFRSTGEGFCKLAHELTHRCMAYLGPP